MINTCTHESKIFLSNPKGEESAGSNSFWVFLCPINYNRVFVTAFSLKALYQPIGKESKSEVIQRGNRIFQTDKNRTEFSSGNVQPDNQRQVTLNTTQPYFVEHDFTNLRFYCRFLSLLK